MYISTEINSFKAVGDNRKILKMLKDAGFTAYDFSMFNGSLADEILYAQDYIERAKAFRAYADEIGLPCNQAHAPFPTAKKGDAQYNEKTFPVIVRALEISGILGAKVCVVHPCNDYTAEENAELYRAFEPYARKAGVKIGVENMWNCVNWGTPEFRATSAACSHHDDFKAHLELLPEDVFVACLDIGHAEMTGLDTSAVQMIETLGNKLQALHIHDNDKVHDSHRLPYTGDVAFREILEALEKIGYTGDVTLEADMFARKFPLELYPQAMKLMAETADYMRRTLSEK